LSAVAVAVAVAPGVSDVGFLQYLSLPPFKYQTHIPLIIRKTKEDFSFFLSFLPTKQRLQKRGIDSELTWGGGGRNRSREKDEVPGCSSSSCC
jgi:hypothetical protein